MLFFNRKMVIQSCIPNMAPKVKRYTLLFFTFILKQRSFRSDPKKKIYR